jgi:hypothetical protein
VKDAAGKARRSGREWLLALPEVFSVAEVALVMGCPRTEASQYLWRWRTSRLVQPLGGKSGVFMNLVRRPDAAIDGSVWERALLKAMPSAMIGGHEVLADSGLTTQVTRQRYVLVSNVDSAFELEGAEVHRRPVPWMNRLVREGGVIADAPGAIVPRLRPGAALADLARYSPSAVDPEDVDLEVLPRDDLDLFRRLAKGTELLEAVSGTAPARRRSG